jgi:hypothetical protein
MTLRRRGALVACDARTQGASICDFGAGAFALAAGALALLIAGPRRRLPQPAAAPAWAPYTAPSYDERR